MKCLLRRIVMACLGVLSICLMAAPRAGAVVITVPIHDENFNSGDGGYTASEINTPSTVVPWSYSGTAGVAGTGGWSTPGGESGNYPTPLPYLEQLTSPVIVVPTTGEIKLSFDHKYNFEFDSTVWDGGLLEISLNGGAFAPLPNAAFTLNGYDNTLQTSDDWGFVGDLNGLDVFTGDQSGAFKSSAADIGLLNAGDTLQLRFTGGWDWFFNQPNSIGLPPAWSVDNVLVSVSYPPAPEPTSFSLMMFGGAVLVLRKSRNRRRNAAC